MSLSNATTTLSQVLKDLCLDQHDGDYTDRGFAHWLWFRGQSDAEWKLKPGALRDDFLNTAAQRRPNLQLTFDKETQGRALEFAIMSQFKDDAAHLISAGTTNTELYFLAQHHGIPTRLLDWSRSPLVAIFNAVNENSERDGVVYRINARNVYSTGVREVLFEDDPLVKDTVDAVFRSDYRFKYSETPLPVTPLLRVGRIMPQQSQFTLHPPGSIEFEDKRLCGFLDKVLIPNRSKARLLGELRLLGAHWGSLYPDLDHIAKELKVRHGLLRH
jgi:hypothetical protein